jgi:hypothetical protein
MLKGNEVHPLSQDNRQNGIRMLVHEAHTPILWTPLSHYLRSRPSVCIAILPSDVQKLGDTTEPFERLPPSDRQSDGTNEHLG